MKKITLILIATTLFSCSKDNVTPENTNLKIDIYRFVDNVFPIDIGFTQSNELIVLSHDQSLYQLQLRKIASNGTVTIIEDNLANSISNESNLVISTGDKFNFINQRSGTWDKTFTYSNGVTTSHTLQSNGPNFPTPKIFQMAKYTDNSAVLYDASIQSLKLFLFDSNSETLIAGSGNSQITDGNGSNASFKYIQKIKCKNNKIYVIDDSKNLRKIEYINNQYNVTTLISNYADYLTDIAIDSNNDVYVNVYSKGIYKLNQINNTLELYKNGMTPINDGTNNLAAAIYWESIDQLYINNNDLYFKTYNTLYRITDFKNKL